MKTTDIQIDKIVPYWNNPRNNAKTVLLVEESIKNYGFNQPLVVVPTNGVYEIVVGHTRYFACMNLGFETIPCYVVTNLSDEEVKKYRIADNKTAEFSEWDESKLIQEIVSINDKDALQNFFEDDINDMIRFAAPPADVPNESSAMDSFESEMNSASEKSASSEEKEVLPSRYFRCPHCNCVIPLES